MPFPEEKTQWPIMWVAFGGGIVAATHMGKLPAALPDIMAELNSGLVMGGWIASMISFTASHRVSCPAPSATGSASAGY